MQSEKSLSLLKKLAALAESGVGGEKETAKKKLEELMARYGLTEADLSDDVISDHEFVFKDLYQKRLLRQVFYHVNYDREVLRFTAGKGKRTRLVFRCTEAEALQAKIEYEFFCALW